MRASTALVTETSPLQNLPAQAAAFGFYADTGALTPLAPEAVGVAGASAPHNNLQPYLALNFCIAASGLAPNQ